MNEQRKMKFLFINQKNDCLKEDWDDLLSRLHSLLSMAKKYRPDLIHKITKSILVLDTNKPNKKVYRSILKFANKVDEELGVERVR
ncbi:MAG: hypothetical protein J6S57_02895 [Alphaproteobacteria bacterium]|nr:hypothetical protein [Alphaproteobacteria bacterium]